MLLSSCGLTVLNYTLEISFCLANLQTWEYGTLLREPSETLPWPTHTSILRRPPFFSQGEKVIHINASSCVIAIGITVH